MASCSSTSSNDNLVKEVLLEVEHDDKFCVDSPRANLAKTAAKFILAAYQSPYFHIFSQLLLQAVIQLVEKVKAAHYKSFSTTELKLWRGFHLIRDESLKKLWNELWLALAAEEAYKKDPLLMQHCNAKLFEKVIKQVFPLEKRATLSSNNLSELDESALRYAAGYTIRSVYLKIKRTRHPLQNAMLMVLDQLRQEDYGEETETTYLSYTRAWIARVNRGGLFCIDNDTHLFFLSVEYATRAYLTATNPAAPQNPSKKDEVAAKIEEDPDVKFHWCHLTDRHEEVVTKELLRRLICLWLTIRGFSSVAAFMEEFKHSQHVTLRAKKALRKELLKNSAAQSD